jgi:hypothetical protein
MSLPSGPQPSPRPPLPSKVILEIHEAAVAADLATLRTVLLAGLAPDFATSLTTSPDPSSQLLLDLHALNRIGRLTNGSDPLAVWLTHAAHLAGLRPQAQVFRRALAQIEGKAPALTAASDRRAVALALGAFLVAAAVVAYALRSGPPAPVHSPPAPSGSVAATPPPATPGSVASAAVTPPVLPSASPRNPRPPQGTSLPPGSATAATPPPLPTEPSTVAPASSVSTAALPTSGAADCFSASTCRLLGRTFDPARDKEVCLLAPNSAAELGGVGRLHCSLLSPSTCTIDANIAKLKPPVTWGPCR